MPIILQRSKSELIKYFNSQIKLFVQYPLYLNKCDITFTVSLQSRPHRECNDAATPTRPTDNVRSHRKNIVRGAAAVQRVWRPVPSDILPSRGS